MSKKHIIIPDVQVTPDSNTEHLEWAAKYCIKHKPDVIVCIGDFADMPSLSSYDVGKKSFEGRTYKADIEATVEAMSRFVTPIKEEVERVRRNKKKRWNPRLVLTIGNHEDRITRAIEYDRKLDGLISIDDLQYKEFGWEVYPFLESVVIDGILYAHYFCSGEMGRATTSARAQLNINKMSCVAGHRQGRDICYAKRGDGKRIVSIQAGSFYQEYQGYMNPQTNKHWHGLVVLNEVNDGQCDEMFVSLEFLRKRYG